MPTTIDVKKLIARNKKVDPTKLEEAIKLLRALRKSGVKYSEYELSPPFQRQMAITGSGAENEPIAGGYAPKCRECGGV